MEPLRRWAWPAGVAAACTLLAAFGDGARDALRWQRDLLLAEPWRLVTGHFVHLDVPHLLFNFAGLAVLWALVGTMLRPRTWTLLLLGGAAAISFGLFAVDVAWYVGLSGVLFTLLVAGAILLLREWPLGAAFLLAYVLVKSALEFFGYTTGDDVVPEAHWIGAAAGAVFGVICAVFRKRDTA